MGREQVVGVRWAFREGHFVLRYHGHLEMLMEGLNLAGIREAGGHAEVLEEYPDRPEGRTKLLLGYAGIRPLHLVVKVEEFHRDPTRPPAVVTVYEPESPTWLDERTRGR